MSSPGFSVLIKDTLTNGCKVLGSNHQPSGTLMLCFYVTLQVLVQQFHVSGNKTVLFCFFLLPCPLSITILVHVIVPQLIRFSGYVFSECFMWTILLFEG